MTLDCTYPSYSGKAANKMLKETTLFFDATLNRTSRDVSSLQAETIEALHRIENGDPSDIQKVLTAVEKARTSFDLLMGMRRRAVDTYREIMRNAQSN